MWITQTYLTSPEPRAKLHIYYLFEDYRRGHKDATKAVQDELESLAATHKDVCVLVPNPNSADQIEGEMRKNQQLWQRFSSDLPGVIVSRCPIEKLNAESDDLFFIGLNTQGFSDIALGTMTLTKPFAESIAKLRDLVASDLDWQHREIRKYEEPPHGFLNGLYEAVELKVGVNVGIAAFKVDLKKLFSRR